MLLEGEDEQMVLVSLYVMADDLVKTFSKSQGFRLKLPGPNRRGRPPALCLSEAIALGLFRYALNIKDVKHYHRHIVSHYSDFFPRLPNYQNFMSLLNRVSGYVLFLVLWICHCNKQHLRQEDLLIIDTSALKVCEKGRISEHKVCKGLAAIGKTTQGWFYGFKLGLVVDALGHLISIAMRPGNTDDRKFLGPLFRGLKGVGIGDAGFVSKDWAAKLFEQGFLFLTNVKKSMKRLITKAQHELLKKRQLVEIRLAQLKHRIQQAVSLARSPLGYFSRWVYALLAYCLFPSVEAAR